MPRRGGAKRNAPRIGAHPTQLNHDIFLLDGSGDCVASAALKRGFNDVVYEVQGGQRYYVVVDGYDSDQGAFTLKFEEDCLFIQTKELWDVTYCLKLLSF